MIALLFKYWEPVLLFLLSLAGVWLLYTPFSIGHELADGMVMGKVCWFYSGMVLLSLATIIVILYGKAKWVTVSLPDICILLLAGITLLTYDWALHPEPGKLLFGVQLIALWFILRLILQAYPQLIFLFLLLIIITGLIEALWGIAQLNNLLTSNHVMFRLTGTFFNPGPYSGYLAATLPVALYIALTTRFALRHFAWICICTIMVVLPAGMSRSAWIAAIVSCGWVYIMCWNGKKTILQYWKKRRKVFVFCSIGLCLLGLVAVIGIYRMKQESADGRLLMWKMTARAIVNRPLSGTGLGGFPAAYAQEQAMYFRSGNASVTEKMVAGSPEYAFNEYLQIGVEQGLGGLLIFLLWIGSVFYYTVKNRQYGIAGSLLALAIFAFSSYPFQLPEFWILLIFLSTMGIVPQSPRQQESRLSMMSFRLVVLLSAISSLVLFGYQKDTYTTYEQWKVNQSLYQGQAYGAAGKAYALLYPALNHRPEFLFEMAQCLGKTEQYAQADKLLKRAVLLSADPMLYCVMAKNEQQLGHYRDAEKHLLYALDILPERIYPYYLLVKLYAEPAFYQPDKMKATADSVFRKEPKVESTAINEMREEVRKLIGKSSLEERPEINQVNTLNL